ncbi:type 1 glutamine amidotransferase [Thalassotalea crassostreae]|uniref:type 1 glutamine amidotransferase n=1 Tax=Thalassotalea crassostreae TaxID=1763536 RepID=UPI000839362B|nr:type 1 glutamine amidotransferase [Thalassotalea crassostreae]
MKRIGITQRVEVVKSYGERRDCLDQQWSNLIIQLGFLPIPLPNVSEDMVEALVTALQLDAIILSGGNSITTLNPEASDAAPERDEFENAIIAKALETNIPLIGVCRGMQVLNLAMGGALAKTQGHVGQRHSITSNVKGFDLPKTVNSFHNYCVPNDGLAKSLEPLAYDDGGNIEAFYSISSKILGIMWHPEREENFTNLDIQLLKRFLL